MDENNVQVTTNDVVVDNNTTDVAVDESTGKGKLIFFAIVGMVVAAPITAIVFGILWFKRGRKIKQLQDQVDANKSTNTASVQNDAPKADDSPKTEETPKEETK